MSLLPSRIVSPPNVRGTTAGLVALASLTISYPVFADATARPLAAFALPPLLTAVLAGWRPTIAVGALSLGIATIVGVAGPLPPAALIARLVIIAMSVAAGAVGARFREDQQVRLREATESAVMLRAFERSLAPAVDAPVGYDIAVRYVASTRHMHIGGDFVDAVELADGRLAVVIGDVCGHGPSEAAYGTAFRGAWRTIVLTHRRDPVEWIRRLDATFFAGGRADAYVTMCTGIVDHRAGTATLVSAGHPWPVTIGAIAGLVDLPTGAPLGLGPPGWASRTVDIRGRGIVFYTDGLVENPMGDGPPARWGEDGLVDWLQGRWPTDVEELGTTLVEAALADRDRRDDVALMIVSVGPRGAAPASTRPFRAERRQRSTTARSG